MHTKNAPSIDNLQAQLAEVAQKTDQAFPDNADLRIENSELVLRRPTGS